MSTHPEIDHLAKEERIRAIAYAIWEEEGRPDGCAEEHWLKACDIVEAEAIEPGWLKRKDKPELVAEERQTQRRKVA